MAASSARSSSGPGSTTSARTRSTSCGSARTRPSSPSTSTRSEEAAMLELDVPAIESTETTRGVELRDLEAADWEAVADIYWDGIRDGLATFETAIPSWEDWAAAPA